MPKQAAKKFLCLVYFEGPRLDALSTEEKVALDRDSLAYDRELQRKGLLIEAQALQSPVVAQTVTVRKNKVVVTDGPFAETKEQLGGFILIKTRTMKQAVKVAAGIPLARLGRIEVRPIYDIPPH